MRSRTIREGSVGLLVLVGAIIFGGLIMWLRGFNLTSRSYKFIAVFPNVAGMTAGAPVRYRGVDVGKITEVRAGANGVDVTVEIEDSDLLIPHDARIEANQSGLVGQTSVDITPQGTTNLETESLSPFGEECLDSEQIICNDDRLKAVEGVNFVELLRNSTKLTEIYTDPEFFENINALTTNASEAAAGVAELANELTLLSGSVRKEIGGFSAAAESLNRAADQTSSQLGSAAERISGTAEEYRLTAVQLNRLIATTNELVATNRGTLVRTLNNISQTSDQLGDLIGSFTTTINRVNSTVSQVNSTVDQSNVGGLLQNLETLSANAAEASDNLRDITATLNNPTNLQVLQQTLDSARATFENAQKITADLDELTGDPSFRTNVRELIDGLNQLVSSTEELERQIQVAQSLEPVSEKLNQATSNYVDTSMAAQKEQIKVEQDSSKLQLEQQQHRLGLMEPAGRKLLPEEEVESFE